MKTTVGIVLLLIAAQVHAQVWGISWQRMKQVQSPWNGTSELYSPNDTTKVDSVWAYLNAHGTIADTPVYSAQFINGRTLHSLQTREITILHTFTATQDSQWRYSVAGGLPGLHGDTAKYLMSRGDVLLPQWVAVTVAPTDSSRASHFADSAKYVIYNAPLIGEDATNDLTMVSGHMYKADKAGSLLLLALPVSASFGDVLKINGFGAAGFRITQRTGEQILISGGMNTTTAGVAGHVDSVSVYDTARLVYMGSQQWLAELDGCAYY